MAEEKKVSVSGNDIQELIKAQTDAMAAQAKALKDVADSSIPADSKAILAQQEKDHESPYIESADQVAVLEVSTVDLSTVDGWPGYIDVLIPGEYTKQGLPKRTRYPVEVKYTPGLENHYQLTMMTRSEFEEIVTSGRGIPRSTEVSAQMLRSGGQV